MHKIDLALGALMLDVKGLVLNEPDIRRLSHPSVGGVILFSRNFKDIKQLKALVAHIRALRSPALLIAVDQEGGRVQRFLEGFTRLPPLAMFGERYDLAENKPAVLAEVSLAASLMAQELIQCGIDFSFTPVLDLGVHAKTIIGDRAFHAKPATLIKLAKAYIKGMQVSGMQATAKHFPGHGQVTADSHLETPVDYRDFEHIKAQDMQPFMALKEEYAAVMTAHIQFPKVDEALPTFSSFWLKETLRQALGFKGLIFSDDLSMKGACVGGSVIARANKATSAGCDMILLCNDALAADSLLEAQAWPASSDSQKRFLAMKSTLKPALPEKQSINIKKVLNEMCNVS